MGEAEKSRSLEPWSYQGRNVLDASGTPLATAADPEDARRIVAAVNAVQGMPTQALESWTVEVLSDPALELETDADYDVREPYPNERRARQERRQDDRRQGTLNAPSPWEVTAPEDVATPR